MPAQKKPAIAKNVANENVAFLVHSSFRQAESVYKQRHPNRHDHGHVRIKGVFEHHAQNEKPCTCQKRGHNSRDNGLSRLRIPVQHGTPSLQKNKHAYAWCDAYCTPTGASTVHVLMNFVQAL